MEEKWYFIDVDLTYFIGSGSGHRVFKDFIKIAPDKIKEYFELLFDVKGMLDRGNVESFYWNWKMIQPL
jgi:hypothetical protein